MSAPASATRRNATDRPRPRTERERGTFRCEQGHRFLDDVAGDGGPANAMRHNGRPLCTQCWLELVARECGEVRRVA